jgi:hypothetical protein
MSPVEELSGDAGERFHSGDGFAFQDAMQHRLRYHLLRLTVVGLSQDEVGPLVELARVAFDGEDVTAAAAAIRERAGATPLAATIAAITERAAPGGGSRGEPADVLLGAVLGAYAGVQGSLDPDRGQVAVLGAVGGAIAASTGPFVRARISDVGVAGYLRTDDSH